MAVNKLTYPSKDNAVQEKINEIIDELGTAAGANIDLSNLSATGESHFGKVKTVNSTSPDSNGNVSITIPTIDQTYNSSSTNAQSGVAIAGAGFLQNTATGTNSLEILGNITNNNNYSVSIGKNSVVAGSNSVALGYNAGANGTSIAIGYGALASGGLEGINDYAIAIGSNANAYDHSVAIGGDATTFDNNYSIAIGYGAVLNYSANSSIQLGHGQNDDSNTFSVGFYNNSTTHYNWQLLDGTTGLIPDARLSSNIARTTDIPSLTNYVTTDTDQNITGVKTFVGQKRIGFKQSGSSDKLGFTLYNNSGTEKGYLEYNPTNTIDGAPLMTLGNYASSSAGLTHVGFRKYSSISGASGAYNLLAPLISDARTPFNLTTTYTNFYLPLGFTDGTTTVTTAKTGLVNISSLLPTVPTKISDLTDDTATYPIDKADTLTNLTATVTELNYVDGVTSAVQTQFDGITDKIPSQATSSNQLADKAFVNSTIQTATANFRGNWDDWALVPTSASSYPADYAGSTTPTVNDYMVVQDASDYTGDTLEGTWRFKYSGTWSTDGKSGWLPEYQVNETPLTSAQLAALNSGITSTTKVTHTSSTAVGNSTTPVYIASDGAATALSYTIEKSVPSNAVFTDTTYSDFTGATSIAGGAHGLVPAPAAGDDDKILTGGATWNELKTVNSTPLLGSGNIDTTEVFVATVNVTTYQEISDAYLSGKTVILSLDSSIAVPQGNTFIFNSCYENIVYKTVCDNLNVWSSTAYTLVNTSGDNTITGNLDIGQTLRLVNSDVTKGTNPSSTKYWQVLANDSSNGSTWGSTRLGHLEWSLDSSGTTYMNLAAIENTADSTSRAQLTLSRTQEGVASATINCALTVQNTLNTTGNITITKNGASQFYAKNSGFNYTSTATTASTVGQFYALDTNGKVCGGFSVNHTDANNATTTIVARRSVSGTEKSAYITLGVDSSGNPYATAPVTPAASSNSTNIATTAFVHNACDGQWVDSRQTILDDDSLTQSSSTSLPKTVTLPNDGYKYEVVFRGQVTTGSASGNYIMLNITGNESSYGSYCCGCRTRTASTMFARGECSTIMSYGSSNLTITRNSAFAGTASLDVIRYRRIGKNS